MTCHDFQSIVVDLARERERDLDSSTRDAAAAHTSGCDDCARALAAERELTGRLSALAAATCEASAPDRVEAALLEAFRARHGSVAEVVPIDSRRATWTRWAVAAAAGMALAGGAFTVWQARHQTATPPAGKPSVARVVEEERQGAGVPERALPPAVPSTPGSGTGKREASTVSRDRAPRAARRTAPPRADEPMMQNVEFASEFYPLVAGGGAAPLDGGQIVRMEVPRASLTAMGLMPSDSRANESVTADVLIGHDGMARAIRFVQPAVMTERSSLK